ncbi:MAG: hypothetical protein KGL39_19030 [Patescibacteria group bacterium]|nr:hypothetical protein [Patescibacteria group bacterium]
MSTDLTAREWELHRQLVTDYQFFSRHIQKIEPKDIEIDEALEAQFESLWREDSIKGLVPFIFRPGQLKLHHFVEDMKRRRGLVKAALVKPRQVGWSSYIQGRSHWLCTKTPGLKVQIISHTKDSTVKFLRRIRKMCAASPPTVTPGRPLDNTKEIGFANGAYISVATAGSPDAVRSDSAHILHASEETSWENELEVWGSILPAMSFGVGSESFRETTSKGRNTPWHQFILEALAGENDWEVFFDAYFNDPRYRLTPPPGWEPDAEAREHGRMYGLGNDRLYWRAMMIKQMRAMWLFKQEYPSTIDESFQSSEDTLYKPDAVYRAALNGKTGAIVPDLHAPLIMGVDPARTGDRTAIAFRQGKVIREVKTYGEMDDMRLVGIISKFLQDGLGGKKVAKCFIDYAIGEGVASRLRELGYSREVCVVNFGESPIDDRYANKRAEMYMDLRDWFGDTGEQVSIPNNDDVIADLLAIPDFLQETGSDKIKLASKKEIKKKYHRSPDIADSIVLTFAYPVQGERIAELQDFAKRNLSHLHPTELSSVLRDFEKS